MEKFFLESISSKRKKEIIEYLDEFANNNSDLNGFSYLAKINNEYTFERALEQTLKMQNADYAKKINRCTSKTFLLIRKSDNKIVGNINVRWNLTETVKQFGGNIGYSIRPTERQKGYNKINLYLGLLEAKKLGLKKVMLDCESDNIASYKTMASLGGVLTRTEIDPTDGILTKVYWFDVDECIKKYQSTYENII